LAVLAVLATPARAQDQANVVSSCGSVTLTPGTQSFRTIDLNGVTCTAGGGGGTSGSCSEATAYLGRTVGGNEGGNSFAITNLICGLVTDGVWSKLDAMYVLAQQNATDAHLNLISSSYSVAAGATFTTYRGLSAFPPGGLDTGFNPAVATAPKFTLASATLGAWSYDTVTNSQVSFGSSNNFGANYIIPLYSGGFYSSISGSGNTSIPSPGLTGMFATERTNASNMDLYWDGAGTNVGSPAAGYFDNLTFRVGDLLAGIYTTTTTVSEAHVGAALGAAGNLAIYNRFATYLAQAGTGCPEATAYLARAPGETAHAVDLTNLICGLVADGVWAKLDALYIYAQQTSGDALLNLVSTNYTSTAAVVNFTAYKGFNEIIDTHFDPTTAASPKYTQNNANYGFWSYVVTTSTGCQAGRTAGNETAIYLKFSDGNLYARLNNQSAGVPNTIVGGGMAVADRPDASNTWPYQNGVSAGAIAAPSVTMSPGDVFFGGCPSSGVGAEQILSEAHIGASLGAAGNLALYNRVRAYIRAVRPAMTWDPATNTNPTNLVLSNGNLTGTWPVNNGSGAAYSTPVMPNGKVYWEVTFTKPDAYAATGFGDGAAYNRSLTVNGNGSGVFMTWGGDLTLAPFASGDVLGIALDPIAHLAWLRRNTDNWNNTAGADPATGTGGFVLVGGPHGSLAGPYYALLSGQGNGTVNASMTANFGATDFVHAPPAGFNSWINTAESKPGPKPPPEQVTPHGEPKK
jgi:hypothetical protein